MSWKHTCPACGMSWTSDSSAAKICPYCRYDITHGKMPGENGYNGNWNYDTPQYTNTGSQADSYGGWGGVTSWKEFFMWLKFGGYLIGIVLVLVWMFGLGFDFEWEFFQICFYGLCAILVGVISGIIQKKLK